MNIEQLKGLIDIINNSMGKDDLSQLSVGMENDRAYVVTSKYLPCRVVDAAVRAGYRILVGSDGAEIYAAIEED